MVRRPTGKHNRTVFLVDEWASYRRSLQLFLEAAGHRVSGEAETVEDAETAGLAEANVVILEPRLPWADLEQDLKKLRQLAPTAAIVLLSAERLPSQLVLRAALGGMSAYLTKDDGPAVLLGTIDAASSHKLVTLRRQGLSDAISRLGRVTSGPRAPHDVHLTRREHEILWLAARAYSNRQIADMLWVTLQTVQFHLGNTYRKLGVTTRAAAVAAARSSGLLS